MALKIGDRVRYLNEVGGGVVTRILKDRMVNVLQDDGFEMPILAVDCVFIEATQKPKIKEERLDALIPAQVIEEPSYLPEEDLGVDQDTLRVLLAFVPVKNQDNSFEVYLINDSNFYLYFSLLQEQKGMHSPLANGLIECNTKLHLSTVSAAQLEQWERLAIQLLPFKKQAFVPKGIVEHSLRLNAVKFYKSTSFSRTSYFAEPAMIEELVSNDFPEMSVEEVNKIIADKAPVVLKSISKPHRVYEKIEQDLHINKLLDQYTGMSNLEILNHQLDVFHQVMQAGIGNHGQELVFIHGIGNGTLKAELRKQLKEFYPSCDVQDASFKEYGFGATRVSIA